MANLWDEFPWTSRDSCGSEIVGTLRLWKLSFEEALVFVLFDQVTDASTAWVHVWDGESNGLRKYSAAFEC